MRILPEGGWRRRGEVNFLKEITTPIKESFLPTHKQTNKQTNEEKRPREGGIAGIYSSLHFIAVAVR